MYKVLGYFSCLQIPPISIKTTFKDPGTVKIRENKLVSCINEDNPNKANLSTLLIRHRTGNVPAFSE